MFNTIQLNCDALCNLVPRAQIKIREKHPWSSATFSKVASFTGRRVGLTAKERS